MGGARLSVKVTARAAGDQVVGWTAGRLRVRITAPPEGGRANAALEALLAERVGRPRRAVRVVTGHTSTLKLVEFAGLEQADLDRVFGRP